MSSNKIPEETWEKAIKAIEEEGLSYRVAGAKYGVNPMSLYRRKTKQVAMNARPGPQSFLNAEQEKGLLDLIAYCCSQGMIMTHTELRSCIHTVVLVENKGAQIPETFPSAKWLQRFIKRHPTISSRNGKILDCKIPDNSVIDFVKHHIFGKDKFEKIEKVIKSKAKARNFMVDKDQERNKKQKRSSAN